MVRRLRKGRDAHGRTPRAWPSLSDKRSYRAGGLVSEAELRRHRLKTKRSEARPRLAAIAAMTSTLAHNAERSRRRPFRSRCQSPVKRAGSHDMTAGPLSRKWIGKPRLEYAGDSHWCRLTHRNTTTTPCITSNDLRLRKARFGCVIMRTGYGREVLACKVQQGWARVG